MPRYLATLSTALVAAGDLGGALDAQRKALSLTAADNPMREDHEEVIAEWLALQESGGSPGLPP